jgi:hypothetical protein
MLWLASMRRSNPVYKKTNSVTYLWDEARHVSEADTEGSLRLLLDGNIDKTLLN